MQIQEAALELRKMYDDETTGKAVSVHLFGIRHAASLEGMPLKELAARAGIPETYATEIRKGVNLSAYVIEK